MKRVIFLILCSFLLCGTAAAAEPVYDDAISISAPSAILMEQSTGTVLYEKDAYAHLSPASVTKVMTMLLIAEAVDSGVLSPDDIVTASAHAAEMGGSQIWLEQGEQMTVGEMLKCVAVVSANDCCVALAEHLCGSETAFVARMNERASELGMEDTHFTSCSGLSDSDAHYTCARDIAVMSRELLMHDQIRAYTTIWMDSIRDGEFGLSNTNKLIYYYQGATGLKTGFTNKAMFCLSASAKRDGVEYIAVILHAPSSAERFEDAKTLLSYGFANYTLSSPVGMQAIPPVTVTLGEAESVQPLLQNNTGILLKRSSAAALRYEFRLPEQISAPVVQGQVLGSVAAYDGDTLVQETPLVADDDVARLGIFDIFGNLRRALVVGRK